MKPKHLNFPAWIALGLVMPASADVIYSNLQDIAIPATFDGLYLNVETGAWNTPSNLGAGVAGWDVNPFSGGKAFANSPGFQPVRSGTTSSSPILNLAAGVTVGSGSTYSTFVQGPTGETPGAPGYGSSQMLTGSGGNFTAATEGYLGFKLNGTNYGSMRVILTDNAGGALIKDWAYDNTTGAPVVVGAIKQVGQDIVLSSGFTLASALVNSGGTTNLVKNGSGTNILTNTNTYTGTTTVSNGSLLVNGSITGTGAVIVGGGADVATLGGSGAITGAVTINDKGILAPGNSIESLAVTGDLTLNTGSTFAYEMKSGEVSAIAADFQKVFGNLALSGTVTLDLTDIAGSPVAFAPNTTLSLINYTGTLNSGFFTYDSNELSDGEQFTAGLNTWQINYDAISGGINFASEYHVGGKFITLTAVPEPGSWLALGCLVGSGAFLRRRRC
jgi:fibronectin-binding autotransporter adhesin